jgi:Golgi SNAP receptor complex protein 1
MDEVINIAQTTKGALGAQRSTFMEIQGKVKQLGDRFPAIRGVLGMLSFMHFQLQNLWPEIS